MIVGRRARVSELNFALDSRPGGFGFAFTTAEACETIRREFNGYSTPLGSACALVSLTLLDAPVE